MNRRPPEFITFTGLDARTDLKRCANLSARYPIEWGVLFSASRQGQEHRYPDVDALSAIWVSGVRLAAHLCGQHARDIMAGVPPLLPVDFASCPLRPDDVLCNRVQVNHQEPNPAAIHDFLRPWERIKGIAQARGDAFPAAVKGCDWLFDRSGGTGQPPAEWPRHPGGGRLVGYAGGIGPENVLDVLNRIGADGPFWIDMESGVRTDDWLDLDKVEAVCRSVFGVPRIEGKTS